MPTDRSYEIRVEKLLERNNRQAELLREVVHSGGKEAGFGYVTVQIDRDTWDRLVALDRSTTYTSASDSDETKVRISGRDTVRKHPEALRKLGNSE